MNEPIRFLAPEPLVRRLSRRGFLTGSLVGLGALAACSPRNNKMAASPKVDGALESKLNVYTWGDYDDPALIDQFKEENDVLVQVDSFGSNEELIAKLAASRGTSGYDVVVPTGLMIPQMIERNLLQPLDRKLIPNFSNMDPNFTAQYFDPKNEYSICKAWGTTGFVYDTTVVTRPMASWQDFIDAANEEATGVTSVLEDPWEVCSIALGAKGYDLNTTDPGELDECRTVVLDEIAPNVRAYLGNAATGMAQGSLSLLQAFNGDARQGLLQVDDPEQWKFVFPTPSANLWMDNWCLATGAPDPDAAHAFINFMIGPESAITNVDYIGYPVGTKGLEKEARAEDFDFLELIFPAQDILDRLQPSEYNSGQQARVDIFAAAQARSGA